MTKDESESESESAVERVGELAADAVALALPDAPCIAETHAESVGVGDPLVEAPRLGDRAGEGESDGEPVAESDVESDGVPE